MAEHWYIRDRGQVRGPFSREELLLFHRRGQLARFQEISTDRARWSKAGSIIDQDSRMIVPPAPPPREAEPEPVPWPTVDDDAEMADEGPGPDTSRGLQWVAILAVPVVLLALVMMVGTFAYLNADRLNMKRPSSWLDGSIRSTLDQEEIAASVGLVVVGFAYTRPNGEHGDMTLTTGSCFAITEDGSLLTNRHVVQLYDQMENADGLAERQRLYLRLVIESSGVPEPKREQVLEELIKKQPEAFKFRKIEPRLWVFFTDKGGRHEKKTAKLVYLGDPNKYDLAILKVDRPSAGSYPYFRLANGEKKMRRGDPVVALGFPGTTRNAISADERVEEILRHRQAIRVESSFKDRDFEYVRTGGEVSVDFLQSNGQRWIQHNAAITHGNSGGPLVDPRGLVVGINTRGEQDGATFQALSVVQLGGIIREHVPRAAFSDD